ncbi:MAG TPA: lysoplasmalogenase [Actinomycetota bacterium]|nr:lysoplasmalogenase [Actinomycetota bacterium]
MTDFSWLLFDAAIFFAAADWIAVALRNKTLEYVCKPAAIAFLIAVALAVQPRNDVQRWAFVVALVFSLAGDVLLMVDRFLPGLIAFFGGHVAYIVGLRSGRTDFRPLLLSALIVFVAIVFVGARILVAVRERSPELGTPVSAYIAVISVMVACALASGNPLAATGAALFMVSDSLIAWNRFVKPLSWAPITIIVTYHLAQAGLVLSLSN